MAGTILGQRQSDQLFVPFDPNATDGSQQPRGLLHYHVKTNEEGEVVGRYFGMFGLGMESCGPKYTNMYVCGIFRLEDIVGDVAAAAASGWLKLVDGFPGGNGIVRI